MARQGGDSNTQTQINVNATIRAVLELVTAYIQRDRVTLRVEIGDKPLWTAAPAGQLEDVWLNLLLNARYAVLGVPNAMVGIRSEAINGKIRVEVWDNGRGISVKDQARIFEAFFTTKPMGEGTGLGLYICKQVIDGVGGTMGLQSVPGEGTRFTITLRANDSE
jgi:two-component system NtrC family sensor kinase